MRQITMHERNGHCALTHRRRAAFNGTVPHVTGGKHSGRARFEVVGVAFERPVLGVPATPLQVRSSQKVPLLVACNPYFSGPPRVRYASQTQEKPSRLERLLSAG